MGENMSSNYWRCPHCIREIDLSVPEGQFAKRSHEKSHHTSAPSSGPRHAKPRSSSGGWADAVADFLEKLFD